MKIVLFGDSIMEGKTGIAPEESFFPQLEKFCGPSHRLINAGKGGNSAREAMARLESDVLIHEPDLILLEFGGNNHDPRAGHESRRVNDREFTALLERFQSKIPEKCRVMALTFPPIINHRHQFFHLVPGGLVDEELQSQRQILRERAKRRHWLLLDLYELVLPRKEELILPDGIHLNPAGHRFLAEKIGEKLQSSFPEEF